MADGVLLDMDGVLVTAWRPLPGAVEALAWLRRSGIPFLVATNATSRTRAGLSATLKAAGLDVGAGELLTSSVVTGAYLRREHPGARCFLLGGRDAAEDLGEVDLVEEKADVVVVAGPDPTLTWESLSHAFRMLLDGAALVAMHRNLSWMTDQGMQLDAGAFVCGLEEAAGVRAAVTGKPSQAFFRQGLDILGVPADRAAMVGDDIAADVLPAQRLGLFGVLVRTGKFRPEQLQAASERPDAVIDSVRQLPEVVG